MKTIALDIGNVCLKICPERCLQALGLSLETGIPDSLMKSISEMEIGLIAQKEWLNTFQDVTNHNFSDDQLCHAYNLILGEEIEGISDFIHKANSKEIRIIFFSDTSPIHLNHLFRNLSFSHLISGGIYSFEVGAQKPDLQMYQKYEEIFGKPIFYIDDKKENVDAGKTAGWNSFLYESIDSIKNLPFSE